MLGKKNSGLAAMELTDDEIELVSGGAGYDDNGELVCPDCGMRFEYHSAAEHNKALDAFCLHRAVHMEYA